MLSIGLLISALLSGVPVLGHPLPKRDLVLPVPHDDPFYEAPTKINLESLENGEVYDLRSVTPPAQLTYAESAVQIAYKTTDTSLNASHTVATVLAPSNPDKHVKVVSYQIWEDSENIDCSPSYTMYAGTQAVNSPTFIIDGVNFIDWALENGYYVFVPDHEGPKSEFFAGFTEGHAGIDGIRAGLSHLNLSNDTPVALYGYSGGAHATVWMSDLMETYAPELNIVGAVTGGTAVDAKSTFKFMDGTENSGLVLGALGGLLKAYPTLAGQIWSDLDDTLRGYLDTVWSNNTCFPTTSYAYENLSIHTMTTRDFYNIPAVNTIFNKESLLSNVSSHSVSTPKFPRLFFHSITDDTIPIGPVKEYISQQCDDGANIQFVQWPSGDHKSTLFAGMPDTKQFIKQAFDYKVPQLTCGTAAVGQEG